MTEKQKYPRAQRPEKFLPVKQVGQESKADGPRVPVRYKEIEQENKVDPLPSPVRYEEKIHSRRFRSAIGYRKRKRIAFEIPEINAGSFVKEIEKHFNFSEPESGNKRVAIDVGETVLSADKYSAADALDLLNKSLSATMRKNLRGAEFERRVRLEREGVPASAVVILIGNMDLAATELFQIFPMPQERLARKVMRHETVSGVLGQSIVYLMDLINKVEDVVDSTAAGAEDFDAEAWVGRWIKTPQPALAGKKPIELMDTPSGRESVTRVLGAISSGAYL